MKTWFVTGSAKGLGRAIVEAALAAGDRVAATARNVGRLDDLAARYGERFRAIDLDVTDEAAVARAVAATVEAFGGIDVCVNNAGYATLMPFEHTADFRAQIETNLFGVVNVTRAVIPVMRRQGHGYIVQVSSIGGRLATGGLSAYQAAKWAVGGLSQVVAQEVAPFGIRMTVLEPGGMDTDWGKTARRNDGTNDPAYADTVGRVFGMLARHDGRAGSDPARIADILVRLADHPAPPMKLILGSDARHYYDLAADMRRAEDDAWLEVTRSSDFKAEGPIPAFPT